MQSEKISKRLMVKDFVNIKKIFYSLYPTEMSRYINDITGKTRFHRVSRVKQHT